MLFGETVKIITVPSATELRIEFIGGCSGNTSGIASLLQGMDIDFAIERLEGIKCGFKDTSCPDQLAKALRRYKEEQDLQ